MLQFHPQPLFTPILAFILPTTNVAQCKGELSAFTLWTLSALFAML